MARINIYLPDDLAERVRAADINVSAIAQDALERELKATSLVGWLQEVGHLPPLSDHPGDEETVGGQRGGS
jgi:post-segregation antitoxin (ccd killing protein)